MNDDEIKCKRCGGDTFVSVQTYYLRVVVNSSGEFIQNDSPDGKPNFVGSEKPNYPDYCDNCGKEL